MIWVEKGKKINKVGSGEKLTVNDFKMSEQRLKVIRRFKMIEKMKNGQK